MDGPSLRQRINFHNDMREGANCDLQTPASIICNTNVKHLLTPASFDVLPLKYQNELIRLLPESDRLIFVHDNKPNLHMTNSALSNEFFAKSCVEYKDRLKNGEFCSSARLEGDQVIWDCEPHVLDASLEDTGVPKAGKPVIPSALQKARVRERKVKKSKKAKSKKAAKKEKSLKVKIIANKGSASSAQYKVQSELAKKALSKARNQHAPHSYKPSLNPEPEPLKRPVRKTKIPSKPDQENKPATKVEKVTPAAKPMVLITDPHDQVVTTQASYNALLINILKRSTNIRTTTCTTANKRLRPSPYIKLPLRPIVVNLKPRNLPDIVKAHNPPLPKPKSEPSERVVKPEPVTPQKEPLEPGTEPAAQPPASSSERTVSFSTSLLSAISTSSSTSVAPSQPLAVTSTSAKPTKPADPAAPPTLDLQRSVEICKQILGRAGNIEGPSGLLGSSAAKLVRPDLLNKTCDVPLYKNRHRGKANMFMTSHSLLSLREDEFGYTNKSLKKRSALRAKPKKRSQKLSKKGNVSESSSAEQQNPPQPATPTASTTSLSVPPLPSYLKPTQNCVCARRALVICSKCGAFSHAECTMANLCLTCAPAGAMLMAER